MTTTNQAYKRATNSTAAKQATEAAKSIGEEVSDFAGEVSRMAGKQFTRAQDTAVDALQRGGRYDEALSVQHTGDCSWPWLPVRDVLFKPSLKLKLNLRH